MRVLVCPDKFAGTLSAARAAQAIAAGWHRGVPGDEVICQPLSDGGPGFLDAMRPATGGDAMRPATGGRMIEVPTVDPLGRPVTGRVLIAGRTAGRAANQAFIESADVCGLHLLTPPEQNPMTTSSYGLGALVRVAVEQGVGEIVIGLGGSATNDAGAGMLAALGAVAVDPSGTPLPPGGGALARCAELSGTPALALGSARTASAPGSRPVDPTARLVGAYDVTNPLVGPQGATVVYGPQKGATDADVVALDGALAHFAQVLERDLPTCPAELAGRPAGGAAGGLAAAILATGGALISGSEVVWRATGFEEQLDRADLVITGEGSFDEQSLRGKVVSSVAQAAARRGRPCLVLAGRVTVGRREATDHGVTEAYGLVDHFGVEAALTRPAAGLGELAGTLARHWPG